MLASGLRLVRSSGTLLCLASAASFGAMGVFGKLAYEEGSTVGTLLSVRFAIAALVLWVLVHATRDAPRPRRIGRRDVALALALGACGYAAQAGAYFAALPRIDVSLLSLLVYAYPAIVTVSAIAIGRERADARRLMALALASIGLVLVLSSARAGGLDTIGVALGLGAAVAYSVYILSSQGIAGRMEPRLLAALVCSGATVTLTGASVLSGDFTPGAVSAEGWLWLACIALVSTVAAIALFFAGLARAGPSTASILSTLEPVVTVVLAFLVFGEILSPIQILGGILVLSTVVVLRRRSTTSDPERARLERAEVARAAA